jgi:hypothetical protein
MSTHLGRGFEDPRRRGRQQDGLSRSEAHDRALEKPRVWDGARCGAPHRHAIVFAVAEGIVTLARLMLWQQRQAME